MLLLGAKRLLELLKLDVHSLVIGFHLLPFGGRRRRIVLRGRRGIGAEPCPQSEGPEKELLPVHQTKIGTDRAGCKPRSGQMPD